MKISEKLLKRAIIDYLYIHKSFPKKIIIYSPYFKTLMRFDKTNVTLDGHVSYLNIPVEGRCTTDKLIEFVHPGV